jgi:hypothetical protein
MSTQRLRLAVVVMVATVAAVSVLRAGIYRQVVVVEKASPNGARLERREYRNGQEHGVHRGWYPNGARRFIYRYKHGLMEGVQEAWYPDGTPYTRFEYVAGHEVGRQQMWTDRGILRANYVVVGNRRYGLMGTTGCMGTANEDSLAVVTAAAR